MNQKMFFWWECACPQFYGKLFLQSRIRQHWCKWISPLLHTRHIYQKRVTRNSVTIHRIRVHSIENGKFILLILAHAFSALNSFGWRLRARVCVCVYVSEWVCICIPHSINFDYIFTRRIHYADIFCMFVLCQCFYYTLNMPSVSSYTCTYIYNTQRDEVEQKFSSSNRMENTTQQRRIHWRRRRLQRAFLLYSMWTKKKSVHRKTAAAVAIRCSSYCCHRHYIQYVEIAHGNWSSVIFRSHL